MHVTGTNDFLPKYSAWLGRPICLVVMIRQCRVPMQCYMVGESAANVRIRIHPGWEMDIRKDSIIAVEESVVIEPGVSLGLAQAAENIS
jgi:hypothetical protein